MRLFSLFACAVLTLPGLAAPAKIVFVTHQKSHGPMDHEYAAGARLMGHWLGRAYGGKAAFEYHIGWPKDPGKAFADAATVVFFCSGGGGHLVMGHEAEFNAVMRRGVGLVSLHYGVEVPRGPAGEGMLNWMGGYFEAHWSVNPHWKPGFTALPDHPVTRGVKPFAIDDEWYYHMRFREGLQGVTPILSAVAPPNTVGGDGPHSGNPAVRAAVARGEPQHMAWAYQRGADYGDGRGFGFTGLHYHKNWMQDDFRKVLLNAVAWTARLEIPANGVDSPAPTLPELVASTKGILPGTPAAQVKPLWESRVISANSPGQAVDVEVALAKDAVKLFLVVTDGGDGFGCDWADWAEPRFVLDDGSEIKLTERKWISASSGWGEVRVNRNAGGEALRIAGRDVAYGLGTHAESVIGFDVPVGAVKFKARAGLDDAGTGQGCGSTVSFAVFDRDPGAWAAAPATKAKAAGRDPADALAGLDAHEGVEASLWAAEPLLLSPSSIDVDARGRVWVAEVVNYRGHKGKRAEGDRILILEDTDRDGSADKQTVFYQAPDFQSPHGLTVLGNRALVVAGEEAFYLIDDNGDDKADRKELLFTKVGGVQHDHNLHAFHFGPDGKLYFNFGNAGKRLCDKDGRPVRDLAGNLAAAEGPYRQGLIFRCDLDGTNIETLAWNFRNNWEVAVDAFGGLWQSDNDDDGNRGVRINYIQEFGNYGYGDELTGAGWQSDRANLETEIPLRHWHLNDPGVVPNLIQTGAGSPTGIVVYEGTSLPAAFLGQPLHCDAGPNVVRAYPTKEMGAGFSAEMLNLLEGKRDKWFRPSDVAVAPDGSVFVADWYDPGVGGHGMGDLERGRIFRVQGKNAAKVQPIDVSTTGGAMQALISPNMAARYLGWQALARNPKESSATLRGLLGFSPLDRNRARALGWLGAHEGHQVWQEFGLVDASTDLRVASIRALFTAWRAGKLDDAAYVGSLRKASIGAHPRVRATAAIHLRFVKTTEADALWADLARASDGNDRWMTEALGIGADLSWDSRLAALGGDLDKLPEVLWRSRGAVSAGKIAERIIRSDAPGIARWVRALHFQPTGDALKAAIRQAFTQAPAPAAALVALYEMDPGWVNGDPDLKARLTQVAAALPKEATLMKLAARFGVEGLEKDILAHVTAQPDDPLSAELARGLLGHPQDLLAVLRQGDTAAKAVARAMGKTNDRRALDILRDLVAEATLAPSARQIAVDALAPSGAGADRLFDLAKEGKMPAELKFAAALALSRSPNGQIRERAARELPLPVAAGAEKLPAPAELLKMKGDAARGQAAFTKATCATCHVVQGAGLAFGPDLSQIGGKLPPEAMLEAILHPSNAVAHGFKGVSLALKDGSSAAGIPVSEDGKTITLSLPAGARQTVNVADVLKREELADSLMPPGLAAILGAQELADLLAWLASLK